MQIRYPVLNVKNSIVHCDIASHFLSRASHNHKRKSDSVFYFIFCLFEHRTDFNYVAVNCFPDFPVKKMYLLPTLEGLIISGFMSCFSHESIPHRCVLWDCVAFFTNKQLLTG